MGPFLWNLTLPTLDCGMSQSTNQNNKHNHIQEIRARVSRAKNWIIENI